MNKHCLLLTALAAILVSGCGKSNSSSAAATAPGTAANPRIVEITANDLMKYDVTTIDAQAGEVLTVVLTNAGNNPITVMGHDWVLLKKGSDSAAYSAAAAPAKDSDYIPAALNDEVIAKIGLLGPRKSDQVTFTVPSDPGDYPYLCTFPAHYQAGMHGDLVVK